MGAPHRTCESGTFLRCNLLWPDERPSHNGPSPAYEASVEQDCSLKGDYNGFTTDLIHSIATSSLLHAAQLPLEAPLLCYFVWFY